MSHIDEAPKLTSAKTPMMRGWYVQKDQYGNHVIVNDRKHYIDGSKEISYTDHPGKKYVVIDVGGEAQITDSNGHKGYIKDGSIIAGDDFDRTPAYYSSSRNSEPSGDNTAHHKLRGSYGSDIPKDENTLPPGYDRNGMYKEKYLGQPKTN